MALNFAKFDFASRLKRLQKKLGEVDLLVLGAYDKPDSNVFYYSGDETFPSLLLVTHSSAKLISTVMLPHEVSGLEFKFYKSFRKQFNAGLKEFRPRLVGLDNHSDSFAPLSLRLKKKRRALKAFGRQLIKMREAKDEKEIYCVKKAQQLTKKCVSQALEHDFVGKTENAVAGLLEKTARDLGASLDAFPPIVTSGARTAIPHATPSNKKIRKGEPVLIDCGARFQHYCGDYTTTVYEGKDPLVRKAMRAVLESKRVAEKRVRHGAKAKSASDAAVQVLKKRGFVSQSFKHIGFSLGHAIGLDVHDGARLVGGLRLRRGMVFTVEPGVYFRGKWGVRFEDIIVVK